MKRTYDMLPTTEKYSGLDKGMKNLAHYEQLSLCIGIQISFFKLTFYDANLQQWQYVYLKEKYKFIHKCEGPF